MNGCTFTARAQKADALTDISGVYGEKENEEAVTVNGCEGSYYTVKDGDTTTMVCLWFNPEEGAAYAITVTDAAMDKDSLLAVAEASVIVQEADPWTLLNEEQATVYSDIISDYLHAHTDLQEDVLTADEKNELYGEYMLALDAQNFGYALKDIDNNGMPELLMATDDTENDFYHCLVVAMYRTTEDGAELVFESGERDRWYYVGDNLFAHVGSSSATDSFDTLCAYEGGQMVDLGFSVEPETYEQLAVTYLF